ncbi:hypothetical protein D3C86_1341660 [compost metagenome]
MGLSSMTIMLHFLMPVQSILNDGIQNYGIVISIGGKLQQKKVLFRTIIYHYRAEAKKSNPIYL